MALLHMAAPQLQVDRNSPTLPLRSSTESSYPDLIFSTGAKNIREGIEPSKNDNEQVTESKYIELVSFFLLRLLGKLRDGERSAQHEKK